MAFIRLRIQDGRWTGSFLVLVEISKYCGDVGLGRLACRRANDTMGGFNRASCGYLGLIL